MAATPPTETAQARARPPVLALKDVVLIDGARALFSGVDLALGARDRACLVGRNGSGKSTLLRLLAGRIEPDDGSRFVQPGLRIALVEQEPPISGATLLDHATGGGAPAHAAAAALERFGLDPGKSAAGLSGGEARRAALARALAEGPDLLLLDEPTNHLDVVAISVLEREISRLQGACLVVSHDRAFLEAVTQRCFWLQRRRVTTLEAGFTAFDRFAAETEAAEAEALRRLEKAIERETYTFYRSITAQRTRNEGRARLLQDMRRRRAEVLSDRARGAALEADLSGVSGKRVIEAVGISKSLGGRELLKSFSTRILRGDRVAVIGRNGAGKTTLVRLLLGETAPDAGEVKIGTGLSVVYLDQGRADLAGSMTLAECLTPSGGDSLLVGGRSTHVAAYAKAFGFTEAQLRQPVASLSGGERNRLLLARALAQPSNLLVLDEPTNDLDMETLDRLEDMLAEYEGTLLLVSHDRDFIDRLATSTIALDGRGRAVETPGGWADFLAQNPGFLAEPASPSTARGAARSSSPAAGAPAAPSRAPAKLSFKDERRLKLSEEELERLPGEIRGLEARLADPELYARSPTEFAATAKALESLRERLALAEADWLRLEELKSALSEGRGLD